MSALLCCGHVFYTPYLSDDGIIYKWLDMLLTSKEEKVRVYEFFIEFDLYIRVFICSFICSFICPFIVDLSIGT